MIWDDLGRRQQLWLLEWQTGMVRDLLLGPSSDLLARASPGVLNALEPLGVKTSPIPLEICVEIESMLDLPSNSLRPLRRVPDEELLEWPDAEDLRHWRDAPSDAGPVGPAEVFATAMEHIVGDEDRLAAVIRAAWLDVRTVRECLEGSRRTVPLAMFERLAHAIGEPGLMTLRDEPPRSRPHLSVEERAEGMLISLYARMTRVRAEALAEAMGPEAVVAIEPADGPTADPVSIRLRETVGRERRQAVLNVLMGRYPA